MTLLEKQAKIPDLASAASVDHTIFDTTDRSASILIRGTSLALSFSCNTDDTTKVLFTMETTMLRWAIVFFLIALLAAAFGFGGIAGEAAWMGKVLALVFLVLFIFGIVVGNRKTLP